MRRPSLAFALLPALLAAGCGSGGDQGQDPAAEKAMKGARRAIEAYLGALKSGDCPAAYETLSWNVRKALSLEQLKRNYDQNRDYYRHLAAGKIEDLHYDDFRVLAKLVTGDGRNEFVALIPETGGWKIEETGSNYADLYRRVFAPERKP